MCGVGWNISGEGDTSVRAGQHRREGPPGQGATSTSGTALISVYSQVPVPSPWSTSLPHHIHVDADSTSELMLSGCGTFRKAVSVF